MEIFLCNTSLCTGCMACKQSCKVDAIKIIEKDGFDYPVIDKNRCKSCGLCISSCPIINSNKNIGNCHEGEFECVAAWNKNEKIREISSSGGVFSAFAELIIHKGGVVYGAAWDDDLVLEHRGIEKEEEIDTLRRSKYVQSNVRNTYNEVRSKLIEGKYVLYSGTPCQIAGLKTFLKGINGDKLFTVDVLCQGVPSPYLFKKYICEVEKNTGEKVVDVNFRSKKYGWRCGILLLLRTQNPKNKKIKQLKCVLNDNTFYNSFISEYFMRPSCYDCQFKNDRNGSFSDLTIADFWRIGDKIPFKTNNYTKGISSIVINTNKGLSLYNETLKSLYVVKRSWREFSSNGGLRVSKKPKNNDEAFKYLLTHSWKETQIKFFPISIERKIRIILYLMLKEKRVRFIRKILGRIK